MQFDEHPPPQNYPPPENYRQSNNPPPPRNYQQPDNNFPNYPRPRPMYQGNQQPQYPGNPQSQYQGQQQRSPGPQPNWVNRGYGQDRQGM
ncbi:unnamed protein product, partial [Allacma fusca]